MKDKDLETQISDIIEGEIQNGINEISVILIYSR